MIPATNEQKQKALNAASPIPADLQRARVSISVPATLHRRLKTFTAGRGITIQEYVISVLEAALEES